MTQPGLTDDACAHCCWPRNEHHKQDDRCPDYSTADGWLDTHYRAHIRECQHCGKPIKFGPTEDREPHWRHAVPVEYGECKGLVDYYVACHLSATPKEEPDV